MNRNKILIVMAAGSGVRMGSSVPKQFLDLDGVPVLRRTIEKFVAAIPGIKVITVLPKDHIPFWKEYCLSSGFNYPQTLVAGGITRFHSVRNALSKVPDRAVVAIHDGVRPLLSTELIKNMFAQMDSGSVRALIPVVPSVDTLKVIDKVKDEDGNEVLISPEGEEVDRSRIFGAQTPQMFLSEDIKTAYSQAFDTAFTDDASVARKNRIPLSFCNGERYNFKLTSPEDLSLARLIISFWRTPLADR
ncbi:MAG TPA: 2-C-methyl-D-erythritol 4-phosphate cytidylyltransferase [Rikenellaceae bacterium]|nr:2-C-methyl-D-erythritol 4-phosphate cytidylyltransferase [Rikenellaceae bacterium]HCQ72367.1 2-C-methyl-D-erythritol 4-phosphate cytidylyltransferase [Rikenellaceae bacterium]